MNRATDEEFLNRTSKEEDVLAQVVQLLSRPFSRADHYDERVELLRLTASLLLRDKGVLFVWLLDTSAGKPELRLDQVFTCEPGRDCEPLQDDCNIAGAKAPLDLKPHGHLDAGLVQTAIGIDRESSPAAKWFRAQALGRRGFEEHLEMLISADPDKTSSDPFATDVGAIQILLRPSGTSSAEITERRRIFTIMANAIAGRIESSRRHRIWTAQAELNRRVSLLAPRTDPEASADDIAEILTIAARIVGENSRARSVCVDYIRAPGCERTWSGLFHKGQKPHVDPRIRQALTEILHRTRRPLTIADIYDPKEIERVLGRSFEHWPQRREKTAWMGVPVMSESIKNRSAGEDVGQGSKTVRASTPICTIQAFSKTSPGYIYDTFSSTDFKLAKTSADALAHILPVTELRLALQTISTRLTSNEMAQRFDEGLVIELVERLLPCATYAAVLKETGVSRASKACDKKLLENSKGRILQITEEEILTISDRAGRAGSNPRHMFVRRLYDLGGHYAHLVIGLAGDEMPSYRQSIVRYLCQEVAAYMSEKYRYEKNLREIVEVRHAIRSGLTGAIGHLTLAQQRFAHFKDKSEPVAYKRIVAAPAVRRCLERARFFAERTRIMYDQSRFLLSDLTPENLKIISFGVPELINEVVSCVRPEAEGKGCTIHLRQGVSREYETGWADRDLYYVLLFNIIENAVKYSFRDQSVQVTVFGSVDTWRVEVSNIGVPIPNERKEKIFEPFTRGPALTHPDARRPGTGLGLAVAERIIAAHDSSRRIWFESQGIGRQAARTTFVIPLPRRNNG